MSRLALLTGSAGFVGRHFHRRLEDIGYDVIARDTVHGPHDDVRHCLPDGLNVDLLVHCAAVVGGRTMIEGQPLLLATEDLSIDAAVFAWASRNRPGRMVYFSSSAAYPVCFQTEALSCDLRESDQDAADTFCYQPDQTYGWVKLTGERLAQELQAEGVPCSVFRPFSGYGTDQHLNYPFPSFIQRARAKADPFDVWGDGTQQRDFVHIDDVVQAVMAAIDLGVEGPVNIGTGRATSFIDLAELCIDTAGYTATIRTHPDKPHGVWRRVADCTALNDFYTPSVTLEEGIARAMRGEP